MARTGQAMRQRTRQAMTRADAERARPAARAVRQPRLGDRLRYAFDNSMASGTKALIAWLSLATFVLILVFAVLIEGFGLVPRESDQGFWHQMFSDLLHALDPGTIGGDSGSWRFLLTMLALTIAGLFIVSALIGVIATGIDAKLADLRRGRSLVLERDHTVVLGWSEAVFTALRELCLANQSRPRSAVVVLADRDKVQMEDELHAKVPDLFGTRVICRSGSPMDIDDVAITSPGTARVVIVLAPDSPDPDAEVIKTLLALGHAGSGGPRVVAEIRNPRNLETARLVAKDRAVMLDMRETVARLVVQASRQSGVASIYVELMDFGGSEIYFVSGHALGQMSYADAQLAFETVTVIGVIDGDTTTLNPPADTLVGELTLIVIAEDDSALTELTRASVAPDHDVLGDAPAVEERPTSALLIGWNQRAPIILRELDQYVGPGSRVAVLTAFGEPEMPVLTNLAVTPVRAATTDRDVLEQHVVAGLDQVIVLCYSDDLEAQTADAHTLITLLHVRDILAGCESSATVVSEMLDDRNRVLAQVAHVDDVVVSGEIVSLLVTQLAEDPRHEGVFQELLGSDGSEIYLRPAEWYVRPGVEATFATIVAGAVRRGETALGYRVAAEAGDAEAGFGVRVNPAKSETFRVSPGDRVVVLAED